MASIHGLGLGSGMSRGSYANQKGVLSPQSLSDPNTFYRVKNFQFDDFFKTDYQYANVLFSYFLTSHPIIFHI